MDEFWLKSCQKKHFDWDKNKSKDFVKQIDVHRTKGRRKFGYFSLLSCEWIKIYSRGRLWRLVLYSIFRKNKGKRICEVIMSYLDNV